MRKPCQILPVVLGLLLVTSLAQAREAMIGVNVINPYVLSLAKQDAMLDAIHASGVSVIRASITLDDKGVDYAEKAWKHGIRIEWLIYHFGGYDPFGKTPLSAVDPEQFRATFKPILDRLEAKGIVLAAFELGNEINLSGKLNPRQQPLALRRPDRCRSSGRRRALAAMMFIPPNRDGSMKRSPRIRLLLFFSLCLPFASASLNIAWTTSSAAAQQCAAGVNVNSFQNFSADEQMTIVDQLKQNGVGYVRTSLRPDDKNMALAKTLQSAGIGLVLNIGWKLDANAPERPEYPKPRIRAARPLSRIDLGLSKDYFQTVFDKLDAYGVTLTGIEVGNEINWVDFNGDFPMPGRGKAFSLSELSTDPVGKQVAEGLVKYLRILALLKEVRGHSKLNTHVPIITAGMATVSGGKWQADNKLDGVNIPVTYAFLRAHGLDDLADGYGVHSYPPQVTGDDKTALPQLREYLNDNIFPNGNAKPFWLTEWGYGSDGSVAAESQRARSVAAARAYFRALCEQGRLKGVFWYVWNAPDNDSIYRDGKLMPSGKLVVAPMK